MSVVSESGPVLMVNICLNTVWPSISGKYLLYQFGPVAMVNFFVVSLSGLVSMVNICCTHSGPASKVNICSCCITVWSSISGKYLLYHSLAQY